MITRRDFLKLSGAGIAALFAATRAKSLLRARAYQSSGLSKFAQPLRGVFPLDPNGIPVAVPDGTRRWGRNVAQHYTIDINQYTETASRPRSHHPARLSFADKSGRQCSAEAPRRHHRRTGASQHRSPSRTI